MKNNNFAGLYIILVLNVIILILTGLFLGKIFDFFSVQISPAIIIILQTVFILSGLFNVWLLYYAKKKLS